VRRVALALLAIALLLAGCGVGTEHEAHQLDAAALPAPVDRANVYLVEGDGLRLVPRLQASESVDGVLGLLLAGATPGETGSGLRSAIPSGLELRSVHVIAQVATIDLDEGFGALVGQDALLAVAEIVLTVTRLPDVAEVAISVGGRPLDLPAPAGTLHRPGRRSDYVRLVVR
jgi:hypothetical protein